MSLTNAYTLAVGRIPDLFAKIKDGQAPETFSVQLLKDWGFTSSNDRATIPLLKELGFLTPDGKPTPTYHEYRNHSQSEAVMAGARVLPRFSRNHLHRRADCGAYIVADGFCRRPDEPGLARGDDGD